MRPASHSGLSRCLFRWSQAAIRFPGRFDQYMYPYFKADYEAGKISVEFAQELIDCIWVKLNDLNKVRDAASAEGSRGTACFRT